jgi:hypothetical protein
MAPTKKTGHNEVRGDVLCFSFLLDSAAQTANVTFFFDLSEIFRKSTLTAALAEPERFGKYCIAPVQ